MVSNVAKEYTKPNGSLTSTVLRKYFGRDEARLLCVRFLNTSRHESESANDKKGDSKRSTP